MWKLRLADYVIAQGHPGGGAGHETQALCSSHLDRSLALALGGLTAFSESSPKPCQSACAHLLPWWWIPSSCHTVHWTDWTGPSVAGFFQVQVWFLNIAAPSLWEGYQLSLEGLLTAFHLPLPHTRTTGDRTLGAKKGDIEYAELHGQVCGADVFHPKDAPSTWNQGDGMMAGQPHTDKDFKNRAPGPSCYRWENQKPENVSHFPKTTELISTIKQNKAESRERRNGRGWDQGLCIVFIWMSRFGPLWTQADLRLRSWESMPRRQGREMRVRGSWVGGTTIQ